MENVIHMRPWSRYLELIEALKGLNYFVSEQVLNAANFGVPQSRRRLFVICDRKAPPPTIRPPQLREPTTARSIIDDTIPWKTTKLRRKGRASDTVARADRAISVLGANNPFLIVYYGSDGAGGWQPLTKPLRTVTTVDRFALVTPNREGHEMRMLQVPELQRAMGLPLNYQLPVGTRRDKIRLLGNGVCPPVMRSVLRSLTQQR
jgi:DNA (cytosine-5)-methyltransferase 1